MGGGRSGGRPRRSFYTHSTRRACRSLPWIRRWRRTSCDLSAHEMLLQIGATVSLRTAWASFRWRSHDVQCPMEIRHPVHVCTSRQQHVHRPVGLKVHVTATLHLKRAETKLYRADAKS